VSNPTAVTLSTRSAGSGPALIVLHGLFGSGTNWRTLTRALEPEFCVHLVDARNHGNSPHNSEMTYAAMASDVAQLIAEVAPEGAHVLGHSMGGKTAMMLALTRPELVTSLLVADVAPVAYQHNFKLELKAARAVESAKVSSRSDADSTLCEHIPDASLRAFLLQNLVRSSDGFSWRVNLNAIESAMDDLTGFSPPLSHYEGPVSIVRGANSDYVLEAHTGVIAELFPNARFETIDAAGHWLHAEQPAAFLKILTDHLTRS
jgi:esterase